MNQQAHTKVSVRLQVAQTIAVVLIVPAISLVGYWINDTMQDRTLSKEYVELATSIIREYDREYELEPN